jgi:predicted permease
VTLRQIYARIRSGLTWRRRESELDEEIQFHLSEEAEERAAAGLSADHARVAAIRDFGNVCLIRERTRDVWGWGFVERLVQDVRYGLRTMRRHPGFSLAVIVSFALGTGANTAVFSLMDAVMFRLLPVNDPERLVILAHRGDGDASTGSNYPLYETLRTRSQSFDGVLAFWALPMKLKLAETVSLDGQYVTPNYFSVLGVQPSLGRSLDEADATNPVAVISYGLWMRAFGGSPDVIGERIVVNGVPLTIVGVHPQEFFGIRPGSAVDISVPLGLQRRLSPEFGDRLAERGGTWGLCIMARLRSTVSVESARLEAEALIQPWVQEVVIREAGRAGSWARIELLAGSAGLDTLRRQFSRPLRVLMAVVVLVLLIACANITNLLLARSARRRHEIAVRASIGAGRFRIVRQLLTESFVLAVLGGLLGLPLAIWAAQLLVAFLSTGSERLLLNVTPDLRVLVFTAAISFITAIVSGLLPALRATNLDLSASLKAHAVVGNSDMRGHRARTLLVTAQVGMSMVLLIAASLFLRSLGNIRALDPGFDMNQLLLVSFDRLGTGYRGERLQDFYRQVLDRLAAVPAVRSASLSSLTPLSGDDSTRFFNRDGSSDGSFDDRVVHTNSISPQFFETLGIPLVEGRQFSTTDSSGSSRVAILSQAAARRYFPERSAVGSVFRLGRTNLGPPIEIVGVVGDMKQKDLRDQPPRLVYFPLEQVPQPDIVVEVRTGANVPGIVGALRHAVRSVNPDIPVSSIRTVREQIDGQLIPERLIAILSSLFGLLALSLAAVGLYGVVSYAVTVKTSEIGIRVALGANRSSVLRMILWEAELPVAAGAVLGALASLGLARIPTDLLFGLTSTDLSSRFLASIALLGVAAIAAFIPAHRASRIDPVSALRQQ